MLRTIAALAVATAVLGGPPRLIADEANKPCPFDVALMDADELGRRLESLTGDVLGSCATNAIRGGDSRARSAVAKRAVQLLPVSDQYERMRLISLLGEAQDHEYVPYLLGLLGNRDLNVQHGAIEALKRLSDPRAIRPLADLLRDQYVYRDAMDALKTIGGTEAADALVGLARDKKVDIYRREEAAMALRVMGDPRALAISREVESAARPPWEYLLVFPPLVLWLNWRAAKADLVQGKKKRFLLYVLCASCMLFVAPLWFRPGGRNTAELFVALALGLPLGTTLLAAFVGVVVRRRNAELGNAFLRRVPTVPLAMWGGLVFWMVAFVVAFIIGMSRVHS